jgi:hypothetical protein
VAVRYLAGVELDGNASSGWYSWYSYPGLFFAVVPMMILVLRREQPQPTGIGYALPLVAVVYSAVIGTYLTSFYDYNARYSIPIFPLMLLSIFYWWQMAGRTFFGPRGGVALAFAVGVLLTAVHPQILPGHESLAEKQCAGRKLYDRIGDRVDEENRLLMLPYGYMEMQARWITNPLYFGENGICPRPFNSEKLATYDVTYCHSVLDYDSVESLIEGCRREGIRYVYIAFAALEGYYETDDAPFTKEEEKELIAVFLEQTKADRVGAIDEGVVYEISP